MYINPLAMEHGVSSINFDPHTHKKKIENKISGGKNGYRYWSVVRLG